MYCYIVINFRLVSFLCFDSRCFAALTNLNFKSTSIDVMKWVYLSRLMRERMKDRRRAKIEGGSDNNEKSKHTCTVSLEPAKFEAVVKIDNFGLCMCVITQIDTMLWIEAGKKTRNVVTPPIFRISRDGFKIDLLKWQLKTWRSKIIAGFHVCVKYDQLLQHISQFVSACTVSYVHAVLERAISLEYWKNTKCSWMWLVSYVHLGMEFEYR